MGLFRRIEDMFRRPQERNVSWEEAEKTDPGKFTYDDDGFTYAFADGPEKVRWSEIERIVAFFADDRKCLDIFWKGWKLTITEGTPGWDIFLHKMKVLFPEIPENW